MSSKSFWNMSGETATAVWKSADRSRMIAELIVPTDTPLEGTRLKLGDNEIRLLTQEKISPDAPPTGQEERTDLYTRGDDVIMQFKNPDHPFLRTIYWRVIEDEDTSVDSHQEIESSDPGDHQGSETFAVELIYSLETDQLDTRPQPEAVAQLPMESFKAYSVSGKPTDQQRSWEIADGCDGCQLICARLQNGGVVAVGVLPSDLDRIEVGNQHNPSPITFHLQSDFLEKGVIRRHRMFICGSADSNNQSRVMQRANDFLNSKAPLTT